MRVISDTCREGVKGMDWRNRAVIVFLWNSRGASSLPVDAGER